jgi:uncharacterized protein YegL
MSQLHDLSTSILHENTFCFHNGDLNFELNNLLENSKFGILNFKAITSNETNNEVDIIFSVDCSASMIDRCSDNRTKMQHIIHTLKNMLLFFKDHPNIKVNITINTFHSKIHENIPRTRINDKNIHDIISEIDKIFPLCGTNIELALKKASENILEVRSLYPDNVIYHIFMTDGDATEGSRNINELKKLLDPEVPNLFIGFGIDHDASLLNGISSFGKNSYYFIDKIECAGLVYGEILHGIIYRIMDDSFIEIENGLVYDYKTNSWVNQLAIGNITSEADKTFNIVSSDTEICKVNIKGNFDGLLMTLQSKKIEDNSLFVHIFRQRTLQLLYEANNFCSQNCEYNLFTLTPGFDKDTYRNDKKDIQTKLVKLLEEIKKYMNDNDLKEDKFLKNLCDDIYICYRTLGTKLGSMFCFARQTSQGAQRSYSANNTDAINNSCRFSNYFDSDPMLRHNHSLVLQTDEDNDDLNTILEHEISNFEDTPYSTAQTDYVMRGISRSIDDDDVLSISTQNIY